MSKIVCSNETKAKILELVREKGVSVNEASKQFGVHHKTIYSWLSKLGTTTLSSNGGKNRNYTDILRIKQLERENQELVEIIGRMVLSHSKIKKKDS